MTSIRIFYSFSFLLVIFVLIETRAFAFFDHVPNIALSAGFAFFFALHERGFTKATQFMLFLLFSLFVFSFWLLYFREILIVIAVVALYTFFLRFITRYVFADLVIAVILGTVTVPVLFYAFHLAAYGVTAIAIEMVLNIIFTALFYYCMLSFLPHSYEPQGYRLTD